MQARRDLLCVSNSNLPPILHRFCDMADYWSNFCSQQGGAFLLRTRWGLTPKFEMLKFGLKKLEISLSII